MVVSSESSGKAALEERVFWWDGREYCWTRASIVAVRGWVDGEVVEECHGWEEMKERDGRWCWNELDELPRCFAFRRRWKASPAGGLVSNQGSCEESWWK